MGREVVWGVFDEQAVALTGAPGQRVIAEMVDILASWRSMQGREVASLYLPTPGSRVEPEVRGGYPVVEGTRMPYDIVAILLT